MDQISIKTPYPKCQLSTMCLFFTLLKTHVKATVARLSPLPCLFLSLFLSSSVFLLQYITFLSSVFVSPIFLTSLPPLRFPPTAIQGMVPLSLSFFSFLSCFLPPFSSFHFFFRLYFSRFVCLYIIVVDEI